MAKASNKHGKYLVIVESPAKAKTINKYLGSDFHVQASMGHIRDLPSKGLNVDIEKNFEPTYDITPGRKRIVNSLKSLAKQCDKLYLATDLDREGEAIAWHLAQVLGFPEEFLRLWEFYFGYCEAGFRERMIGDVQLLLSKPECRRPEIAPYLG